MSFYDKHKFHNYFVQAAPHLKDVIGIKFSDKKMGQAACITWGRVYKEEKLLELIKTRCAQYCFKNIELIEVCYSLQEIAAYQNFYEGWVYFIQQNVPYKNGYEIWQQRKRQKILAGQDIKFVGCLNHAKKIN